MRESIESESKLPVTAFPQRIMAKDFFFNELFKVTIHHTGEFYIEKAKDSKKKSFLKKRFWFSKLIRDLFNIPEKNYIPEYLSNTIDVLREFVSREDLSYATFWFTLAEDKKVLFYNSSFKYSNIEEEKPLSPKTFSSILKSLNLLEATTVFNRNFRTLSEYEWLLRKTKARYKIKYLAMKLEKEETFKNYYL